LVGWNTAQSNIDQSFATGSVSVSNSPSAYIGGLVGMNDTGSFITDSYSTTGAVTGGTDDDVGGLVGGLFTSGSIAASYSTGAVTSGTGSYIGGLVGYDGNTSQYIVDAYWDTTTGGITNLSQGAGNIANDLGIAGLTTTQFQSGLPSGFSPTIWKEKSRINDGLPYLIANPPPK